MHEARLLVANGVIFLADMLVHGAWRRRERPCMVHPSSIYGRRSSAIGGPVSPLTATVVVLSRPWESHPAVPDAGPRLLVALPLHSIPTGLVARIEARDTVTAPAMITAMEIQPFLADHTWTGSYAVYAGARVVVVEPPHGALDAPALNLPSLSASVRGGELLAPAEHGIAYLEIPLNALGGPS